MFACVDVLSRDGISDFFPDQVRRLFCRAYAEQVASGSLTEKEVSRMTNVSLDRLLAVGYLLVSILKSS